MIDFVRKAAGVRLHVRSQDLALGEAALERVLASGPLASNLEEAQELGDTSAWCKASPLRGRAALRHGIRLRLGMGLPRLREAQNLHWLRQHLFVAPRPLAAIGVVRAGLPRAQWLWTEHLPASVRFLEAWPLLAEAAQAAVMEELAREVARMHALGFIHRDLFGRNLMLQLRADRQVVFLDAWRGGPGPGLRGAAYDLACLSTDLVELAGGPAFDGWLGTYFEERKALDRPAHRDSLQRTLVRERRRLIARLERQPARLRGRPLPDRGWAPPHDEATRVR